MQSGCDSDARAQVQEQSVSNLSRVGMVVTADKVSRKLSLTTSHPFLMPRAG
jgi:hypothetical protein